MITELKKESLSPKDSTPNTTKGVSDALGLDVAADIVHKSNIKCTINGKLYNSFREAAYDIDKVNLVAAEVERRCFSKKIKYKDWNVDGIKKSPVLKISLDGHLFESPVHAEQYVKMNATDIRNRIYSKNPMYRHWVELSTPIENMSYDDVEKSLLHCKIRESLPTIKCEGKEFFSIKEAAHSFGVSDERIRQKLVSDKYTDYIYLD